MTSRVSRKPFHHPACNEGLNVQPSAVFFSERNEDTKGGVINN